MSRFAALALLLAAPVTLSAQTLAEKVPADSLVYVGFKGSNALAGDYQKSHLKGMLDATDLDMLVSDDFARKLAVVIGRENPQAARPIAAIFASVKQMWRYPTAISYGQGKDGKPRLTVLCDAGTAADTLMKQLQVALPKTPDVQVGRSGTLVCVSFGDNTATAGLLTAMAGSTSLAKQPQFLAAMKQVDPSAAVVAFGSIKGMVEAWGPPTGQADATSAQTRSALGVDSVQYIAMSGAFAGQGWTERAFIAAPAPRKGLATLLEGKAISPECLSLVPASAAKVSVFQLDLAALMEQTRAFFRENDPETSAHLEQGLTYSQSFLQLDITKDLLPALGPTWITYADPGIGGVQPLGNVCVNVLRNPQQAEQSLRSIQDSLLVMANTGLQMQKMTLTAYERQIGQTQVHTLALPVVAPSWAIRDGKLYVGLYPQVVVAAADFAASKASSFADNAQFAALQKQVGVPVQSVSYTDLGQLADGGYGTALVLTHYPGFADLFGIPTPTMALPPLPELKKHVSPAMAVTWSDPAGWHYQRNSPFFGSGALETVLSPDTVGEGALATSIMLPSLARAREKANQVKCASNLRMIGQGCLLYANDHLREGGIYPASLGELLATQQIGLEAFVCPSGNVSIPAELQSAPMEQKVAWVAHNSPYIYLGKGLKTSCNPEYIIAYEKPEAHGREGSNVLFADGHVEFILTAAMPGLLQRARTAGQAIPAAR